MRKKVVLAVVKYLAGFVLFVWSGYVGFGWFGFLDSWWDWFQKIVWGGWFKQSESERFIEKCEILLGRIEELRFLAEAGYVQYKVSFNGMAAALVNEFQSRGCVERYLP